MVKIKKEKTTDVPLEFSHNGEKYYGIATPLSGSCLESECFEYDITLNNEHLGSIYCDRDMKCIMRTLADKELVKKIAQEILLWNQ
jgi:hypothetical protein